MKRSGLHIAALCAVLSGLLLVVPPAPAGAEQPTPLLATGAVGDPSVVRVGARRIVVATGAEVPRAFKDDGGTWQWTQPVLAYRPSWARTTGSIWASDLAKVGTRWLLYYAMPVDGLGPNGHCVGVAVGRTPLSTFYPAGSRPLVCPRRALTPRAEDTARARGTRRSGIIDPSYHREGGRGYLLYKTDGNPSSIRLLPLTQGGLHARGRRGHPHNPSVELIRSRHTIENPVLLRRRGTYYMFTSEGDYARCSYRTVWRRSRSLERWVGAPSGDLLTWRRTGRLCGPGGGDILVENDGVTMYFHGWTSRESRLPMPFGYTAWGDFSGTVTRAMYGARLRFHRKVPRVTRYL